MDKIDHAVGMLVEEEGDTAKLDEAILDILDPNQRQEVLDTLKSAFKVAPKWVKLRKLWSDIADVRILTTERLENVLTWIEAETEDKVEKLRAEGRMTAEAEEKFSKFSEIIDSLQNRMWAD